MKNLFYVFFLLAGAAFADDLVFVDFAKLDCGGAPQFDIKSVKLVIRKDMVQDIYTTELKTSYPTRVVSEVSKTHSINRSLNTEFEVELNSDVTLVWSPIARPQLDGEKTLVVRAPEFFLTTGQFEDTKTVSLSCKVTQ